MNAALLINTKQYLFLQNKEELLNYGNRHKEVSEGIAMSHYTHQPYYCSAQWIAECQNTIKDPSSSDWRREKLLEGIKIYEKYLLQCEQDMLALDAKMGRQRAELGKRNAHY